MQILNQEQHRALAYVSAANRGGHRPIVEDLHEWLDAPGLRAVVTLGSHERKSHDFDTTPLAEVDESLLQEWWEATAAVAAAASAIRARLPRPSSSARPRGVVIDSETFAAHLIRLRWLEADERNSLELTPLGRALLRTADVDEDDSNVPTAVVLGAHNELAYPMLIRRLVEAGRGLVIDPYLRLEQLVPVRTHTGIKRVLISATVNAGDRAAMAVLIESGAGTGGPFELRVADKEVLHDRFIVGEGFVDTIGTSINTVGHQYTTVLSPLPSPVADVMREQAEKWWTEATTVAVWSPPEPADEPVFDDG